MTAARQKDESFDEDRLASIVRALVRGGAEVIGCEVLARKVNLKTRCGQTVGVANVVDDDPFAGFTFPDGQNDDQAA